MDVHGRIREVLAETIREELAPEHQQLSTEDLIKALRQRGIIDDVMKELKFVTVSSFWRVKMFFAYSSFTDLVFWQSKTSLLPKVCDGFTDLWHIRSRTA